MGMNVALKCSVILFVGRLWHSCMKESDENANRCCSGLDKYGVVDFPDGEVDDYDYRLMYLVPTV